MEWRCGRSSRLLALLLLLLAFSSLLHASQAQPRPALTGTLRNGRKNVPRFGTLDDSPSQSPTEVPSASPSESPSQMPSVLPSFVPSVLPSHAPTVAPTETPSAAPTQHPSTNPSLTPSAPPSLAPSVPPSVTPSVLPSVFPSQPPTEIPTASPSTIPTVAPSVTPSVAPTVSPTVLPTVSPSTPPSVAPTASPSASPSVAPTVSPTVSPSVAPTASPSRRPTQAPTAMPSYPQEQAARVVFSITQNLQGIDVVTYYENRTRCDPIFIDTVAAFMRGVEVSNIVIDSLDIIFLRQPALAATETSVSYTVTIPNTATVGYPNGEAAHNATVSSLLRSLQNNTFSARLQWLATERQVREMQSVTSTQATQTSVTISALNSEQEGSSVGRFRWGVNFIVLVSTMGLIACSGIIYKSVHASGLLNGTKEEDLM